MNQGARNPIDMQSQRLTSYFQDYASSHRTPGNKACHSVGIPLIVVTTLGLLSHLGAWPEAGPADTLLRPDAGLGLLALAVFFYVRLDWRLGLSFAPALLGCYFLGRALPLPALWGLFVLGWIIQYIGHYAYERKSPSFYKNLTHILIGPLWIFARATGHAGA
jgi:uncharacterized membrane protein YGL010W